MSASFAWVNGEFIEASAPAIHDSDHGFLLGDGVFDTMLVRDGRPIFFGRHMRRLRDGIDRLEIASELSDIEVRDAIAQLVTRSELIDARVRITVTPGPGNSPRERGNSPLTVISVSPLSAIPESITLCTVPWRRNENSPLAGIKSTSWGDNAVILRHAQSHGFDNALLCDSSGRLSECTTSNLFLVMSDEIVTPSLASGCLPGILREVLLEGNLAVECDLVPSDLERASEVFVSSSITGVVPVHRIDDQSFPPAGIVTQRASIYLMEQAAL